MTYSDRFSASRCNLPWAPVEGIAADQTIVASHKGFPVGDTDSFQCHRVTRADIETRPIRAPYKLLACHR